MPGPEQVVHFFRNVVGVATVSKEVLSQRTADYQAWVEAFARNHRLPIEWAEKGVRKEDHVRPHRRFPGTVYSCWGRKVKHRRQSRSEDGPSSSSWSR